MKQAVTTKGNKRLTVESCPYCKGRHYHGGEISGARVADCGGGQYELVEATKPGTWETQVKRVITEGQLIHLYDVTNSIMEEKNDYDPTPSQGYVLNEIRHLNTVIDSQRQAAAEIMRMLSYINKNVEIKERRLWSKEPRKMMEKIAPEEALKNIPVQEE